MQNNTTQTKTKNFAENDEISPVKQVANKLQTILPRTPLTGKRIMIALGAIGFSLCFAGFAGWGQQPFILGFVVMLCAATGFRLIDNGKIFG